MQNLIDDPVFYNLLVNNRESIGSTSSNATNSPQEKQQQQPNAVEQFIKNEQVDFSFLNNVEFPLMNNNNNNNNSISTPSETSYQASIFSENLSLPNQNYDTDVLDDLLSKDINFQISSELPPKPTPSTTKQFHKFYTSTINSQSGQLQTSTSSIAKPQLTYHKCPFCQRQFKNKSYLSRHLKKHDAVKDFKCPFFNEQHTKCHHLDGEFSRKDTFKAHLKSIHFIYPIGVAKIDRNSSMGRCAGCFQEFKSNNDWLNEHIEKKSCPGFAINQKNDDEVASKL